MDTDQRKCYNLRISPRQSKGKPKFLFNQTTIIGSLCNLMANEKVIVALTRVKDKGETEQSIPIGFKIHKTMIPNDIKPERVHTNNIVNIQVFGGKPLPAMIVCVGGKF